MKTLRGKVTANILAVSLLVTTISGLVGPSVPKAFAAPALTGRIVYHSYVSYNDGTSQLFILNLGTGALTNISSGWTNLVDPMNGKFSPDGTKIVFMGRPKQGGNASAWWDIFLYTVGQSGNPTKLTTTASLHDEDPAFSPDGTKIVYKVRPSTLKIMNLSGTILSTIISTSGQERSMPYYNAAGTAVWYSQQPVGGTRDQASIRKINTNGTGDTLVVDIPGVHDYYPVRDTVGEFLYARWLSATDYHDQLYMYNAGNNTSLPVNSSTHDYSDPYPIGIQYISLSSTGQPNGHGGNYDLFIADRTTGTLWALSDYNAGVNTTKEELGSNYTLVP